MQTFNSHLQIVHSASTINILVVSLAGGFILGAAVVVVGINFLGITPNDIELGPLH